MTRFRLVPRNSSPSTKIDTSSTLLPKVGFASLLSDYLPANPLLPADLMNLDIPSGQCVNQSVPQNVTFGEQGGILGHNSGALRNVGVGQKEWWAWAIIVLISIALGSVAV